MHGCGGFDTMDDDKMHLKILVNVFCRRELLLPTTMTMPFNKIEETLQRIRGAMGQGKGQTSCHMEGPFISEVYKGSKINGISSCA